MLPRGGGGVFKEGIKKFDVIKVEKGKLKVKADESGEKL